MTRRNRSHLLKKASIAGLVVLVAGMCYVPASTAAADDWTKLRGGGITDPDNMALLPGHILNGKLTVGAATLGGNPVTMYTYDGSFHKLYREGFGSDNTRLMPWGLYRDAIYIGTTNATDGGELWKWTGSGNPTMIKKDGWGLGAASYQVNPVAVFNDALLVVAWNASGLRLYKYDGTRWTQIVGQGAAGTLTGPGFGDSHNEGIDGGECREFDGRLILPVQNANGLKVYAYDGSTFKKIGQPGGRLWPSSHTAGYAATSFAENRLYMATGNVLGPGAAAARLWRYDGQAWYPVGLSGGLDDPDNFYFQPFVRGACLYIAAWNASDGCRVYASGGGGFTAISDYAFDGTSHNWTCLLASYNGKLLGLTGNLVDGGQVWAMKTGPAIDRLRPDSGPYGQTVRIEGHDFGVVRGAGQVTLHGKRVTVLSWSDTVIEVTIPGEASSGPIVVSTSRGESNGVTFTIGLSGTWYFAEGTTRNNARDGRYEEWISIENPQDGDAHVTLTYMLSDGTNRTQAVTVQQSSRATISVNDCVGPDQDVSTFVESDERVLAERPMYFNYHGVWTGGHVVIGVPVPRTEYYFAEGTTRANQVDGYYEEWLTFQNPGAEDTVVDVEYMLGTGLELKKSYEVKALSRYTVSVNAEVGPDQDVSCVVTSQSPIVAERPMYFNYHGKWTGGHDVVGAPGPGKTFYFAEGTTRNNAADGAFEEWVCLQNAGEADADVTITYYTQESGTLEQDVVVPAHSRFTVSVNAALGPDVDASFKVSSDRPILAERPMYFNYHGMWDGGHNVMGCPAPKKVFYFAEGTTRQGFATWVCVMNPGTEETVVRFRYVMSDGSVREESTGMDPGSRYTLDVLADIGADQDVSIQVAGEAPVVAERPMYFDYHGWATGGSDALGYGL